jgi:Transient receptor potential (TRP) ion channel
MSVLGHCSKCEDDYLLKIDWPNGSAPTFSCFYIGKIDLDEVNFDTLKTSLKAKFDSDIKLTSTKKLVVMMTLEGTLIKLNISLIRSSR